MKKHLLLSLQAQTDNIALTDLEKHALHDAMHIAFNNIEIGLERVSHIVHSISIANDDNKGSLEAFDINACVKTTAQKLSKQFSNNISVVLKLTKLPLLSIDVYKISQLLTNLITNANESIKERGEICISTMRKGNFIEVSVIDDGCGIETHLQDIIFDPCYSTKKDAVETGLGLAISRDIANEHGGTIQILSILGEGSIFTLVLPVDDVTIH